MPSLESEVGSCAKDIFSSLKRKVSYTIGFITGMY